MEEVHRLPKEMGLGLPSVRDGPTQMGIEHLINNTNKDMERGYFAHSHALRILIQSNHWPTEALELKPLKLPTLRKIRLASTMKGLELKNPYPTKLYAASLRAASHAVDDARMKKRHTLQCTMGTK